MGIHTNEIKGTKPVRFAGLRLFESDEFIGISFDHLGTPWPILARKLEGHGVLAGIEFQGGKITLRTSAQMPFLRALVQGHGKKPRLPKFLLAATAIPVVVIASMVPLGVESEKTTVVEKISPVNPCNVSQLTNWLEGKGDGAHISPLETSVLGGVTVGILECSGSRYSYTLGSGDTKRVLKLQKLDS